MANTPSTSEKGHAKNVATFKTLILRCISFPGFNPANSALQPSALNSTYTNALGAIDAVRDANTNYKLRVGDRAISFAPIGKTVTRITKALNSSPGITREVKANLATIVRKYRGARKAAKEQAALTPPAGTQPEQISVSQLSFDSRVIHFLDIKSFLTALPTYASNEADLAVAGVTATATALETANQAVIIAIANLGNERANRNATLYTAETGLVDTAYMLKDYIQSKYTTASPQWDQIKNLTFSRS